MRYYIIIVPKMVQILVYYNICSFNDNCSSISVLYPLMNNSWRCGAAVDLNFPIYRYKIWFSKNLVEGGTARVWAIQRGKKDFHHLNHSQQSRCNLQQEVGTGGCILVCRCQWEWCVLSRASLQRILVIAIKMTKVKAMMMIIGAWYMDNIRVIKFLVQILYSSC